MNLAAAKGLHEWRPEGRAQVNTEETFASPASREKQVFGVLSPRFSTVTAYVIPVYFKEKEWLFI